MCYIDIYFLLNWWMDLQILNLADALLKRQRKRKLLLSGIGALISFAYLWSESILIRGISLLLWILIYKKDIFVVIFSCVLLGGSMYAIPYRSWWIFIILPKIILVIIKNIQKRQQIKETMADVSIWILDREIQVKALIDTGNRLYSYGKPVHIIESGCLDFFINPKSLIYVSFQTVDKECAVMPAIKADKIKVVTSSNEIVIAHSIIGLSSKKLSQDGSYQMLLHSSVERGLYVHWSKCS